MSTVRSYQLSNAQLTQSLHRNLLHRKLGLGLGRYVPKATTLGDYQTQLAEHNLSGRLLAVINGQLGSKNIIMTQGRINLIDAAG